MHHVLFTQTISTYTHPKPSQKVTSKELADNSIVHGSDNDTLYTCISLCYQICEEEGRGRKEYNNFSNSTAQFKLEEH